MDQLNLKKIAVCSMAIVIAICAAALGGWFLADQANIIPQT
jgi:hypothetical protein